MYVCVCVCARARARACVCVCLVLVLDAVSSSLIRAVQTHLFVGGGGVVVVGFVVFVIV